MSTFERYLTLWVALCIVAGIALGHFMPGAFHFIAAMEVAEKISLEIASHKWEGNSSADISAESWQGQNCAGKKSCGCKGKSY